MITVDDNLTPFERCRRSLHRAVDRICDAWPQALADADARGFGSGRGEGGGRSSDVADPTLSAVLRPDHAVGWLAELHDVVLAVLKAVSVQAPTLLAWRPETLRQPLHKALEGIAAGWALDDLVDLDRESPNYGRDVFGLERLADAAARWWPPPVRRGDLVCGVSVGERGNQVEDCGLCGEPAPGGKNEDGQLLVRRIDGVAFHAVAAGGRAACFWTVWRQRRRAA